MRQSIVVDWGLDSIGNPVSVTCYRAREFDVNGDGLDDHLVAFRKDKT